MTGELNEWSRSVPIGETHFFDFELFKNCTDTNIQLLVKLIEKVAEKRRKMINRGGPFPEGHSSTVDTVPSPDIKMATNQRVTILFLLMDFLL